MSELDISGRHITWAGKHPDETNQNAIYLYDIDTGQTQIIAPAGFNLPLKLRISGNFLIWLEAGTVHAYDINAGESRMIQTAAVNPRDLDLSANRLVVEDVSGAIFIYDLMIDEEQRIPNDSGSLPSHPAISGDWVIWQQLGPEDLLGKSDIYFYDITTGERQRITLGTLALQSIPVISGKWIAWTDDRHGPDKLTLYAYNILTGEEILLEAVDAGRIKGTPSLADGRLVWSGAFEHPEDFASNGVNPSHIRIRNVGAGSLEYQIEEWDYLDQAHMTETLAYLVVEAGLHQMQDDRPMEVGTVDTNHGLKPVTFNQSFDSAPVTLSQCQTYNGWPAVTTRLANLSAASFQVRLQDEEGNGAGNHAIETVGYVAVEADQ